MFGGNSVRPGTSLNKLTTLTLWPPYLGTSESPPLKVVGSSSNMEEISFPSGTDTRVYMTLSWTFLRRARKASCSESSWRGKPRQTMIRKVQSYKKKPFTISTCSHLEQLSLSATCQEQQQSGLLLKRLTIAVTWDGFLGTDSIW